MTKKRQHTKVESRNDVFPKRAATRIWREIPSERNPYIAAEATCYGYDLHELMSKRSFVDVFYLLFRGELPSSNQAQLLEALMIGIMNPGPRHPAVRGAMSVAVSKTLPEHILPVATGLLSGTYLGGGEVESAIRFLRKNQKKDPQRVFDELMTNASAADSAQGQSEAAVEPLIPGFGSYCGGVDLLCKKTAAIITGMSGAGLVLQWAAEFVSVTEEKNIGWLPVGLAAAVFADLGFQPKAGGGLFQLLCAPGALAHGLEFANKPLTSMPFVSDEDYVVER